MEREEEEERRRKSVGNKLEVEKEVSVQSLREKTLKFDCENGMEYRGARADSVQGLRGMNLRSK